MFYYQIICLSILFETCNGGNSQRLFPESPNNCSEVLDKFAKNVSVFSYCSISKARPFTICINCVNSYLQVSESYKQLQNTTFNSKSCESILTSQDRLDIVQFSYNGIIEMWNKAKCDQCFDGTHEISNETKTFIQLQNETISCINHSNSNDSDVICHACKDNYLALNDFYQKLSKDATGVETVCMDIVDSMNATREKWSGELDCCRLRNSPEVVFLVCTSIISVFPIIFYLLVRFCSQKRIIGLVIPTRFRQNWSQSPRSQSIN